MSASEPPDTGSQTLARWARVIGHLRPLPTRSTVSLRRRPNEAGIVDCALYADGRRIAGHLSLDRAVAEARLNLDAFVWLGLYEPNAQELAEAARVFELPPLAVEDAVHAHQRPKLERYDNTLFVVLKTARYVEHAELTPTSEIVETGEIMLFVAPRFVVTVRHGDSRSLTPVRADLELHPDLLRIGPPAVLYAVTDRVVDDYLDVARRLDFDVTSTESEIFDSRRNIDVRRIYQLKREIIEFKQAAAPLAHPLAVLTEDGSAGLPPPLRDLFRDVSDHLTVVTGQIAAYDELVGSLLQVNLAQVAVIQNSDMRKISAWAAMVAVPTLLAGIYGMNFEHMPELTWTFGYPLVLIVMASACLALYRAFKRNNWL
ncbi:MAG: magnesium and cobalt transport protein CorA [Frankiaceae bacterium]